MMRRTQRGLTIIALAVLVGVFFSEQIRYRKTATNYGLGLDQMNETVSSKSRSATGEGRLSYVPKWQDSGKGRVTSAASELAQEELPQKTLNCHCVGVAELTARLKESDSKRETIRILNLIVMLFGIGAGWLYVDLDGTGRRSMNLFVAVATALASLVSFAVEGWL